MFFAVPPATTTLPLRPKRLRRAAHRISTTCTRGGRARRPRPSGRVARQRLGVPHAGEINRAGASPNVVIVLRHPTTSSWSCYHRSWPDNVPAGARSSRDSTRTRDAVAQSRAPALAAVPQQWVKPCTALPTPRRARCPRSFRLPTRQIELCRCRSADDHKARCSARSLAAPRPAVTHRADARLFRKTSARPMSLRTAAGSLRRAQPDCLSGIADDPRHRGGHWTAEAHDLVGTGSPARAPRRRHLTS